jgi:hypothetical protein
MALRLPLSFWATCGVTFRFLRSAMKSCVVALVRSQRDPLSPPAPLLPVKHV